MSELTDLLRDRTWSLFVDGENIATRGAAALESAGVPPTRDGPFWRDVYLWMPETSGRKAFFAHHPSPRFRRPEDPYVPPPWRVPEATRAYYYTSTVSDEPEWTKVRRGLRDLDFEPRVFRRIKGQAKSIDLAIATEALILAAEQRTDASVLFTGDGDFVPVVEAMKRLGQRVVVGSFIESTSEDLIIAADDYVDLTGLFASAWRLHFEALARAQQIAQAAEQQT